MRVAAIRTDIGPIYLDDVENSAQRDFSSEPPGQSRYFEKPTAATLTTVLSAVAFVTIQGSNTSATVDTTGANGTLLNIKTSAAAPYTQVAVPSSATLAKTTIVSSLNSAFAAAGLGLVARIAGTNQVTIDTTVGGPSAYVSISAGSPSTAALQTVLGLAATTTTGLSVAALQTAVYPSSTTLDVSSATLTALSTFSLLDTAEQTALVDAIANAVAPQLVESGPVLLSFVHGKLSKFNSPSFQPGGARIGLPASQAVVCVQDDGHSLFTI